jgi:hypothetical protein
MELLEGEWKHGLTNGPLIIVREDDDEIIRRGNVGKEKERHLKKKIRKF